MPRGIDVVSFVGARDGDGDVSRGKGGGGLVAEMKGDFFQSRPKDGGRGAGGAEDGEFVRQDGMIGDVEVGAVGGDEGGGDFGG